MSEYLRFPCISSSCQSLSCEELRLDFVYSNYYVMDYSLKSRKGNFMVRAKLWLRCAAMHDPVTPVVIKPALVSWEAKKRKVDLAIERVFSGEELLRRMKGWVTTDPVKVTEIVKKYGKLKVLDDRELVLEIEKDEDVVRLEQDLLDNFGGEVDIEVIKKIG